MIENQSLPRFEEAWEQQAAVFGRWRREQVNRKPADTAVPAAGPTNAVVLIATASVKGSGQE